MNAPRLESEVAGLIGAERHGRTAEEWRIGMGRGPGTRGWARSSWRSRRCGLAPTLDRHPAEPGEARSEGSPGLVISDAQERLKQAISTVPAAEGLRSRFTRAAAVLEDGRGLWPTAVHPSKHQRPLHNTDPLERLNKEINCRSNVVGIFPNPAAVIRLGSNSARAVRRVGRCRASVFSAESMKPTATPTCRVPHRRFSQRSRRRHRAHERRG